MAIIRKEKISKTLTHKDLVNRATYWLRNNYNTVIKCSVVMSELRTQNTEVPDIIGFSSGVSTLIECKTNRADFLADKKKHFRITEDKGMGNNRYFATPPKLLSPEELPNGWGLIEVFDKNIYITKEPEFIQANKFSEVIMLTSVLRRLEISTAVFVRAEEVKK